MVEQQLPAGLLARLAEKPRRWLVTGGAGFIGSHLLQALLACGQRVRCFDNLATGRRENLGLAASGHGLEFHEGDLRDLAACRAACAGVDVILHQAALGSVPRSLEDPLSSHGANVTGFVNLLWAAKEAGVRRVVYASSSSVYGDLPELPKVEERLGRPLSPYAVTKRADELYAGVFGPAYGLDLIGLRYFNVFGPRQDPEGAYAAVIPRWFRALLRGEPIFINGDGSTSRDFCHVDNVVQANLLAATVDAPAALGEVYNVAVGERTTLLELFLILRAEVAQQRPEAAGEGPVLRPFRAGDVLHSLADIGKARRLLGYAPLVSAREGLVKTAPWYAAHVR